MKIFFKALAWIALICGVTILISVWALSCNKPDNRLPASTAKLTSSNFIPLAQADSEIRAYGSLSGFSFPTQDVVDYATNGAGSARLVMLRGKRGTETVWIMLSVDEEGKVFTLNGDVLDHAAGCPTVCPVVDGNGNLVEH